MKMHDTTKQFVLQVAGRLALISPETPYCWDGLSAAEFEKSIYTILKVSHSFPIIRNPKNVFTFKLSGTQKSYHYITWKDWVFNHNVDVIPTPLPTMAIMEYLSRLIHKSTTRISIPSHATAVKDYFYGGLFQACQLPNSFLYVTTDLIRDRDRCLPPDYWYQSLRALLTATPEFGELMWLGQLAHSQRAAAYVLNTQVDQRAVINGRNGSIIGDASKFAARNQYLFETPHMPEVNWDAFKAVDISNMPNQIWNDITRLTNTEQINSKYFAKFLRALQMTPAKVSQWYDRFLYSTYYGWQGTWEGDDLSEKSIPEVRELERISEYLFIILAETFLTQLVVARYELQHENAVHEYLGTERLYGDNR